MSRAEQERAASEALGKQYRVRPPKHVGHIVTLKAADPPDPGYVRAHCECGDVWVLNGFEARRTVEKNGL